MQVSVETGEGTERKLKIQVPAETLDQEVDSRLKSMSGNVKIDGFRPGKVPLKVIKQRYGAQVFQEVASEMVYSSFRDALTQENLNPTGDPVISDRIIEMGKPLEYTATFDVINDITLSPVSEIKLERLEAEISDADVGSMIETLRSQRTTWKEEDRAAKDGDKISISFKGTVDGKSFTGGDGDNIPVVIGSGSMIPGFEDQLIGLSKSQATTIKTAFPEDYSTKDLAGKAVEFAVEVHGVESSVLPEVDEEFAKTFGIEDGSVERLKQEIKSNMEREMDGRVKADLKSKVMQQLVENNNVDVPESAIQKEAEALQKQAAETIQGGELPIENYTEEAERRVKLGVILGEIIKVSELVLNQDLVKERIVFMSKDYEDPEEFVRHYYDNPELLHKIETIVMEDLAVDWVIDSAVMTNVKTTFDELMK